MSHLHVGLQAKMDYGYITTIFREQVERQRTENLPTGTFASGTPVTLPVGAAVALAEPIPYTDSCAVTNDLVSCSGC